MQKIEYKSYTKPSDFLKLSEGQNIIRIVSDFYMATIFGMRTSKGYLRFGEVLDPQMKEKYGDAIKGSRKWIWVALDRLTGQIGLLEVGPMIGDAICKLAQQRNQDAKDFDIVINKIGTGLKSKYEIQSANDIKPISSELLQKATKEKDYLLGRYYK